MASPLLRPVPPALRVLLPPFPLLTPVLVHLHLILKLALPIPPSSLPSRRDAAAVVTRRPRPTRPFHLAASPAATSSSPCLLVPPHVVLVLIATTSSLAPPRLLFFLLGRAGSHLQHRSKYSSDQMSSLDDIFPTCAASQSGTGCSLWCRILTRSLTITPSSSGS